MPITSRHPQYEVFLSQWDRLRDAFAGQDAIKQKARRETYLPRLEGHKGDFEEDYDGYVKRALWTGFSDRTLDGLVGAIFRKDPQVTFPPLLEAWLEDVTLTGQTITDFARLVFREALGMNWGGCLVDQSAALETPVTERRPALRFYEAEEITNWRIEQVAGGPRLVQVILHETFDVPAADGFGTDSDEQFRELRLDQIGADLGETIQFHYSQQLYRKQKLADGREEWLPFGPPITPLRRGVPLDFIPFYSISADGQEFAIQTSHLLDLVDVNYDHYRLDADHKHGLHFTALPTAWIAGFPVDEEYRIGSQAAWVTDNPQAQAGYMEFSGAGLAAIVAEKTADERRMAVLGARLLEESKRAAETAESIRLRQSGEASVLKTAALAVSASLANALWVMAWWGGQEDPEVDIQLNVDVMSEQITPPMLAGLLSAYLSNAISQRTFLENLVSGEVIQGRTWEEEQDLLAITTPPDVAPLPLEDME